MKWCNARNVTIIDKERDRLCLDIQKKKVYERTGTGIIFISWVDFGKLSGAFI